MTWGSRDHGGDCSAVQDQLRNVRCIQATFSSFAAIRGDGSVVTWGDAYRGGDSGAVQHELNNVPEIQATSSAFAAIRADRSVVTWGSPHSGGDSTTVRHGLQNGVMRIAATDNAFCAILRGGLAILWPQNSVLPRIHQAKGGRDRFGFVRVDMSLMTFSP